MRFAAAAAPNMSDWKIFVEAEAMGFDSAWVPDSQMIWSDTFAVLSLVAAHTTRIRVGTGVAIAPTRLAPVTAHAIASINQLAPGRTFLGIGSGHTSMRAMGFDTMKGPAFRDYLRVVRALLHGEEVEYTLGGETKAIRFLHPDQGYIDTDHPVPIYVGADGPIALKAAGAYGDGRVSGLDPTPERMVQSLEIARQGAAEAGRVLGEDFPAAALVSAAVLKPGEALTSDRVIDQVGATAVSVMHMWYELYRAWGNDSMVPDSCRDEWAQYLRMIDGWNMPKEKMHQRLHLGHATFLVPEERKLVTPALIQASGALVGEPDEIIARLKEQEAAGLREIVLLPSLEHARDVFRDFAEHVLPRY
ncbi:LLM class flavin-dependent oxidoreductase [Iodidimonas sp. SYSU 1G8]|uniref:LLM class flavin-dependent oxidoreductase n=1 Tax=Iodidimonas sp. SYSU 1G8 TaxID=3133967 RepID=UPI0031FE82B7